MLKTELISNGATAAGGPASSSTPIASSTKLIINDKIDDDEREKSQSQSSWQVSDELARLSSNNDHELELTFDDGEDGPETNIDTILNNDNDEESSSFEYNDNSCNNSVVGKVWASLLFSHTFHSNSEL